LAERKEFIKRKKHNPDKGFSGKIFTITLKTALKIYDYEAMTLRQYDRLSGNIKPDMKSYEKMRDIVGADQFYPSANTLITGSHYPTDAAMEKLAEDINAQQKKREQYHRRRMFDPDAPIDYINERNR
uniref:Pre-mRNA-splicing factor SYF2 n=1 Tax=Ascaris lumbricoides TaxID=6252 RepID=A0A0M3HGY5_ASCLU